MLGTRSTNLYDMCQKWSKSSYLESEHLGVHLHTKLPLLSVGYLLLVLKLQTEAPIEVDTKTQVTGNTAIHQSRVTSTKVPARQL